jgi:peptidoglycan/LPS O-acetylase OafA/YrhL
MKKYYGIELLRFLSSLTIVIYHWGTSFGQLNLSSSYPYRSILGAIYNHGSYAVSIFFVISGLVFSNIYLNQEKSSFGNFFIKRLARLYPLHILTLFLLVIIQFILFKILGSYQLYTFNDFYHFLLNFFFILGWGLEEGRSFNSPAWTVSFEIVIYFIFFFSIWLINKFKILAIIFIYGIFLLIDKIAVYDVKDIGFLNSLGMLDWFIDFCRLFFSGVFLFFITKKFKNFKYLILIALIGLFFSFVGNFKLHLFCFSLVLCFILIDNLKVFDGLKKTFQILGNLTYSMYLFHTVTFLIIFLILTIFDKINLFYEDYFFFFYIFFTFAISFYSFKFFEKPLNKKIREKLIKFK